MAILNSSIYRAYPAINQSYLKYIGEPSIFKAKLNAVKEEKVYFTLGTYLDDILVDYSLKDSKYIITDDAKVTEGVKLLVDALYSIVSTGGVHVSKDILKYSRSMKSAAVRADKFVSLGEEKLTEKFTKDGIDYWEFLCNKSDKVVISVRDNEIMMHNYEQLNPILTNTDYPYEIRAKVCLTAIILDIECKGELDYLIINHTFKTWKVVDLKTTEDVLGFKKSIYQNRYDFQMSFYELLVEANLKELGIEGYIREESEWLIASNAYKMPIRRLKNQLCARKSYKLLDRKYIGVFEALEAYKWHSERELWEYPRCYYEDGFEIFNPAVVYE